MSPANALAVDLIDRTRALPGQKLVLSGPAASGKTHLTHVWAAQYDARIVQAQNLTEAAPPELAETAVAVEDAHCIAGNPEGERALFHLHNLLAQAGLPLLINCRPAPNALGLRLADLQSRIDAAAHAKLDAPDDRLLTAVFAKLFGDRQLTPRPDVIPYLLRNSERSFSAASNIVARLDRASLTQRRDVTRKLAAEILGEDETAR